MPNSCSTINFSDLFKASTTNLLNLTDKSSNFKQSSRNSSHGHGQSNEFTRSALVYTIAGAGLFGSILAVRNNLIRSQILNNYILKKLELFDK